MDIDPWLLPKFKIDDSDCATAFDGVEVGEEPPLC